MPQPWNGVERRAGRKIVGRRGHIRAAWTGVRVESVDYDERGGVGTARAWVRLGELTPADVRVELIMPSSGECPMWCEQSYHNGSFVYAAGAACVAADVEDVPETWAVRVTATRQWACAVDLTPVTGGVVRLASGSVPGKTYWTAPQNAITAARVALWTALVGYLRACAPFSDGLAARRPPPAATEEDVDAASDMSFPASDPPAWMGSMACVASGAGEPLGHTLGSPNASAAGRAS
jgi:hypothetical protein